LWRQISTGKTYIWQMNGTHVTSGAFTSEYPVPGWPTQEGVSLHSV